MNVKLFQINPSPPVEAVFWSGLSVINIAFQARFEKVFDSISESKSEDSLVFNSVRHKSSPVVLAAMKELPSAPSLSAFRPLQNIYDFYSELNKEMHSEMFELNKLLESESVPVILLKGSDPLISNLLASKLPRMMHDSDILVRKEDIDRVRNILRSLGYEQGQIDKSALRINPIPPSQIGELESGHYKLYPFYLIKRVPALDHLFPLVEPWIRMKSQIILYNSEVYYAFQLDIHHKISNDIESTDLWDHANLISHAGFQSTFSLSATDILWYLISKLYYETNVLSTGNLRFFHEISSFLFQYFDLIDWDRLLNISNRYKLCFPLFYVLTQIGNLFQIPIPKEFWNSIERMIVNQNNGIDLGDYLPKLLDIRCIFTLDH